MTIDEAMQRLGKAGDERCENVFMNALTLARENPDDCRNTYELFRILSATNEELERITVSGKICKWLMIYGSTIINDVVKK